MLALLVQTRSLEPVVIGKLASVREVPVQIQRA